ncbi:hypothetical protein STEG23_029737 [Scotinomys teguina]
MAIDPTVSIFNAKTVLDWSTPMITDMDTPNRKFQSKEFYCMETEVVDAALKCQLLLIVLMAAMLLPGMKGSPLLVWRKISRTIELQESISKGLQVGSEWADLTSDDRIDAKVRGII